MRRPSRETLQPLTLAEQLDAMLMGWLERRASQGPPHRPDLRATAVVTVADRVIAEVERFCAKWDMTVERAPRGHGTWAVLTVNGPLLAVEGFAEITRMYRR